MIQKPVRVVQVLHGLKVTGRDCIDESLSCSSLEVYIARWSQHCPQLESKFSEAVTYLAQPHRRGQPSNTPRLGVWLPRLWQKAKPIERNHIRDRDSISCSICCRSSCATAVVMKSPLFFFVRASIGLVRAPLVCDDWKSKKFK